MANNISFPTYAKQFKSFWGVLAGLLALLPFGKLTGDSYAQMLFPVLGDYSDWWMLAGTGFVVISLLAVYQFREKLLSSDNGNFWKKIILGGTVLSILAYGVLNMIFVFVIEPSKGGKNTVSIGRERSKLGNSTNHIVDGKSFNYRDQSDRSILWSQGTSEDSIEAFWTPRSTIAVRILLALTYCLMLVCLASLFGFFNLLNALKI